jgi:hypothetical protein
MALQKVLVLKRPLQIQERGIEERPKSQEMPKAGSCVKCSSDNKNLEQSETNARKVLLETMTNSPRIVTARSRLEEY